MQTPTNDAPDVRQMMHFDPTTRIYTIDWTLAPSWACYHTFNEDFGEDGDGQPTGQFWSHRPRIYYGKYFWEFNERNQPYDAKSEPSGLFIPQNVDWKLSLVKHP